MRTYVRYGREAPRAPTPIVKNRGRPNGARRTRPVELRRCKRHGITEFGNYSAGKGTFKWMCKRCISEAVTRRHQKIKRTLVAEAGGCCAVCGYDKTVFNLHFHHVDPATKRFGVSMAMGKSIATFRAEAAKCVLVCANCHGEIEAGLIPSPPPQAKFGEAWIGISTSTATTDRPPSEAPANEHVQRTLDGFEDHTD